MRPYLSLVHLISIKIILSVAGVWMRLRYLLFFVFNWIALLSVIDFLIRIPHNICVWKILQKREEHVCLQFLLKLKTERSVYNRSSMIWTAINDNPIILGPIEPVKLFEIETMVNIHLSDSSLKSFSGDYKLVFPITRTANLKIFS